MQTERSKLICQKCGVEIANQFSVTLTYCTNCGASLNLPKQITLTLPKTAETPKPKSNFSVILLTSLFTSLFILTLAASGFYMFFPRNLPENTVVQNNPANDVKATKETPQTQPSSVSITDIFEISYNYTGYQGIISGTEKSRSTTKFEGFQSNGTAFKFDGEIIYERGTKESEKMLKYRGLVTKEQFEELAKFFIEHDFLQAPDTTELISVGNYRLKIKYTGGEKVIITSNSGKNTPQITAILAAFKNLQNRVEFKEAK